LDFNSGPALLISTKVSAPIEVTIFLNFSASIEFFSMISLISILCSSLFLKNSSKK